MNMAAAMTPDQLRVFFVEDDPMVAKLFTLILAELPRFLHLGHAETLENALAAVRCIGPEIVFVDVNMPDGDGFSFLRRLRAAAPAARLVICTSRDDPALVYRVSQEKQVDLVHKHDVATAPSFLAVVTALETQRPFVSPRMRRIVEEFQQPASFTKVLSDRELDLLPWFGRGLTDEEIAPGVDLGTGSVHWHRSRIMAKLDLHSSAALVAWCVKHGYVERRDLL